MKKKDANTDTKLGKADKPLLYGILFIWLCLGIFGIFTLAQPKWLQELSKPGRTEEAQTYISEANKLMYEGHQKNTKEKFVKAADMYLQALQIDTANVDAINNLATAYIYLGKYDDALRMYNKLMAEDSIHSALSLTNIGDLYERQGNKEMALSYYEKSIKKNKWESYPWRKYGLYLFQNGHPREAIPYLEHAISLGRDFSAKYALCLEDAYRYSVINNNEAKKKLILEHLNSENMKMDIDRYDITIFELLNRKNNKIGYAYLYLGDIYAALSEGEKARSAYQQSISYNPALQAEVSEKLNKIPAGS